jgi:YesN/AraC family two-component response regulator
MKLFIKNMVCIRCKIAVQAELEKLGLDCTIVELGAVEIKENLSGRMQESLRIALGKSGLELMDDSKAMLVEKVKNVIIEMIHYSDELPKVKISHYLSEKLHYNYTYISNLFSDLNGITIEHFIIAHKIERVKELLQHNELTLKEIANKMLYSNTSNLSNQFKKVTGFTPSFFKKMIDKELISLENI